MCDMFKTCSECGRCDACFYSMPILCEGQPGSWAVVPLGNRRCYGYCYCHWLSYPSWDGPGSLLGIQSGGISGLGEDFMWTEGRSRDSQVSEAWFRGSFPVSADGPYSLLLSSSPTDFNGILSAEIGSQVEMECISYSRPESKYHWIHNGSLLSFSEKNITLPSLTWDQMSRYRCIAENSATQVTLYEEVHVQAPCECSRGPLLSPSLPTSMPLPGGVPVTEMSSSACVAMLTLVR